MSVWSPDADVLVLLIDLFAGGHIEINSLKFLTGKGADYREMYVVVRVAARDVEKFK